MSFIVLRDNATTTGLTYDESSVSVASESVLPIMEVRIPSPKEEVTTVRAEDRSKWIRWYLGAPGTLVGTVLGVIFVLVLKQIPGVDEYAKSSTGFGDYFHTIGALYFRALICVTIPLAFVNVTMCVADMTASKMKTKLLLLGLTCLTSTLAIAQGILWCQLFAESFNGSPYIISGSIYGSSIAEFTFKCPGSQSTMIQNPTTGHLTCSNTTSSLFTTTDSVYSVRSTVLQLQSFPSNFAEINYMIDLLTPENLASMLMDNNVIGLVTISIFFGIACGLINKKERNNKFIEILRETHAIFKTMLTYVTAITPIAIMPLFAAPLLAGTHSIAVDGPRLAVFLGTFVLAGAVHCLIVLPLILIICTRTNPIRFFVLIKDALVYGFSCSSSSKSVPIATRIMDSLSGNRNVARFSASIGTCINKSGGSLYISLALIWTFRNAGLSAQLTFLKMTMICVVAFVASLAIPPVRTGGVAVVVCLFTYLSGVPITFSYSFLLVAECILDPLATVINLWGNLLVARITSFNAATR